MKTSVLIISLITCGRLLCQNCDPVPTGVLDGFYVKENTLTSRGIGYPNVQERDLLWTKRVWRLIDLRQRMNYPLRYPLETQSNYKSLWDIIKCGVLSEGTLTLYATKNFDDQFRYPLKPSNGNFNDENFQKELNSYFGKMVDVPVFNPDGTIQTDLDGKPIYQPIYEPYESRDIVQYEIKEDWFFDKTRGVMEVRIIGISPVIYKKNPETGEILGLYNLFWLYFPECRYVFQNFEIFDNGNDVNNPSFDDFFISRAFSSIITKESNDFDRTFSPTWTGKEALLKSEETELRRQQLEQDVWNY